MRSRRGERYAIDHYHNSEKNVGGLHEVQDLAQDGPPDQSISMLAGGN
jgi:hypothetical protein